MDLDNRAQRSQFCAYLLDKDRKEDADVVMEVITGTNKLKPLRPHLAEEMRSYFISRGTYDIACESKMNDGVAIECKIIDAVPPLDQDTQCRRREQDNKRKLQFLFDDVWTYERNGMYDYAKTKLLHGLKDLDLKLTELSVDLRSRLPERLRGVQKKTYKSYDNYTATQEKEPIIRDQELLEHERKIPARREVIARACSEGRYEELQNCFNSAKGAQNNHLLGETIAR